MQPFLRVVEVLPPLFPVSRKRADVLALDAEMQRFTAGVRGVRDLADVFLVANVKDQAFLKLDTVHTAATLREVLGVEAAPVLVVRDQNRPHFLSSALTSVSRGFKWMMIAWGEDYPPFANATNVRDFARLAKAIGEASLIRSRARSPTRIFAPVDVNGLASPRGVSLAKERLRAGADVLLAQPPTTDSGETFDRHAALVENAGLGGKVLLNVFPFKDAGDVRRYERMFGWDLRDVREAAAKGEGYLIEQERKVIRRLRSEGYPGVYLTARGNPAIAKKLLT